MKKPKYLTQYFSRSDGDLLKDYTEEAFWVLYLRHHKFIVNTLRGLRVPTDDAEDLAQIVWVRVLKNRSKFLAGKDFRAWAYVIARNLASNYFRDRRKSKVVTESTFGEEKTFTKLLEKYGQAAAEDLDASYYRNLLTKVEEALEKDTLGNQELRLFLEDVSYEEIASRLNIKPGTVRSRIARARKNLKALVFA